MSRGGLTPNLNPLGRRDIFLWLLKAALSAVASSGEHSSSGRAWGLEGGGGKVNPKKTAVEKDI